MPLQGKKLPEAATYGSIQNQKGQRACPALSGTRLIKPQPNQESTVHHLKTVIILSILALSNTSADAIIGSRRPGSDC